MTKPIDRPPKKTGRGRPLAIIDLELMRGLASIMCTDEEMAPLLGVSEATLRSRKRTDPEFLAVYENARATGKASLRRHMWGLATGPPANGKATMQIWLSKNLLNMTDRAQLEVGPIGASDILDADQADALAPLLFPEGAPVIDIVPSVEAEARPKETDEEGEQ